MAGALPDRGGAGLKPEHAADILGDGPAVAWFEVHAENYMGAGGPPHRLLSAIRERFPLSIHGVGLSIGGPGPLDARHLARLRALIDRYEPESFSEHLAWSSHEGVWFNDLLPLPYDDTTLAVVAAHVTEVQERLGRRMLVENPSRYLDFTATDREEIDFLAELAARTGCGLLLDVNNVAVSALNRGTDAASYIDAFPMALVGEIHMAGHSIEGRETNAPLALDTHDRPISRPVWALYRRTLARSGPRPTLIERDASLPPWAELAAEVAEADRMLDAARADAA